MLLRQTASTRPPRPPTSKSKRNILVIVWKLTLTNIQLSSRLLPTTSISTRTLAVSLMHKIATKRSCITEKTLTPLTTAYSLSDMALIKPLAWSTCSSKTPGIPPGVNRVTSSSCSKCKALLKIVGLPALKQEKFIYTVGFCLLHSGIPNLSERA